MPRVIELGGTTYLSNNAEHKHVPLAGCVHQRIRKNVTHIFNHLCEDPSAALRNSTFTQLYNKPIEMPDDLE